MKLPQDYLLLVVAAAALLAAVASADDDDSNTAVDTSATQAAPETAPADAAGGPSTRGLFGAPGVIGGGVIGGGINPVVAAPVAGGLVGGGLVNPQFGLNHPGGLNHLGGIHNFGGPIGHVGPVGPVGPIGTVGPVGPGGFINPARPFGPATGGFFNGLGGVGGVGGVVSGSGCRFWCRTPRGRAYCCEGANTPHRPVFQKGGVCPPARLVCPLRAALVGPPQACASDGGCFGVDKCCWDQCLREHVCKPPQGVGK